MSHRQALSELVLSGWVPCGIGDWATALRSPDGRFVVRVCPFDPAYAAFIELCRRCEGNPYLPRIYLAADLDGGGSLTVLDHLAQAPQGEAAQLVHRWKHNDGGADLTTLKEAALIVNAEYAARMPWWDGLDLNESNVRLSTDGQLAFIDIFCMDGAELYAQVLKDAAVVRRKIPIEQCRHLLDIPYMARESSPDEIRALHEAWTGSR
ncbi:hypothetical protein [Phytoactinopolyspora halotolerans]|nr:hypothetical protein [Phytoactinopolyspora halotolerans]